MKLDRLLHGVAGDRQFLAVMLIGAVLKAFAEPVLILSLVALRLMW